MKHIDINIIAAIMQDFGLSDEAELEQALKDGAAADRLWHHSEAQNARLLAVLKRALPVIDAFGLWPLREDARDAIAKAAKY